MSNKGQGIISRRESAWFMERALFYSSFAIQEQVLRLGRVIKP